MRKIILEVAVSLDSLIEGPNGEYDWCFDDQDYGLSEFVEQVDTLFIGRKTYDLMAAMGEKASNDFPGCKRYVFSNTLDRAEDGVVIISGDIGTQVEKIKAEEGKDIWLFGGSALTKSLLNLGLVDEIRLAVHPIILGSGKPLFNEIRDRINLTLVDTKTWSSGLVSLKYSVARV